MAYAFNPFTGNFDITGGLTQTAGDARYVLKAGDTMTGNLGITSLTPAFTLQSLSAEYWYITASGGGISQTFSNGVGDPDTLVWSSTLLSFSATLAASRIQSTVATGTSPLIIASTTVNTNLNADMVDGSHVGTSGATIPLLNGTNTWSGVQTFNSNDLVLAGAGLGKATITYANTTNSRTHTVPDSGGSNTFVVAPTSTTATQAMFATTTAGVSAYRAVATGDLPASVLLTTSSPTVTGNWIFTPASNSTSTLKVTNSGNTTVPFNVDTTNTRVGIGTATPITILHLETSGAGSLETIRSYVTSATTGSIVSIDKSAGTLASPTQVLATHLLGGFRYRGIDSGSTFRIGLNVYAYANEDFTPTAQGTRVEIQNQDNTTGPNTPTTKFNVTSGGVQIGTQTAGSAGTSAAAALEMIDASDIALGTTTGTKIGTSTSQKLGFFNATPVVQQGATTDLGTALSNLGLRASGTAYPITTSGAVTFTGGVTISTSNLTITDVNIVLSTSTGTKIGTGTTQKIGFWNATPVVQSTGWTISNVTTDKVYDADSTTVDELADVLGTLINQLKTYGILA